MSAKTYAIGDEPVPGSGYRLVQFLGRGGFGEVWKASAPGGTEAALKIIRLGGVEGRKEFRALQLVKRIRHANLVPIVGFWLKSEDGSVLDDASTLQVEITEPQANTQGTAVAPPMPLRIQPAELVIAMGLGDESLYDRLLACREEGLSGIPTEELFDYLDDAAEAIDFLNSPLHDLGSGPAAIQHCDVKPHNLLIVGGAVQVCDFGLARMMGAERATTAAASIAYAAPECLVEGQPSDSTDQYSLAITFYELKTGELPYQDTTMAAVMDAKRGETLDFAGLPEAQKAVLRHATRLDPRQRYPSCREMVNALREATAGDGRGEPKRHWGRGVALALAVGAAGAAFWLWQWGPWPENPSPPVPAPPSLGKVPVSPSSKKAPASPPSEKVTGSPPVEKAPAPPSLEKADELFGQNNFAAAIEVYNDLIRGDPHDTRALLGRACCYAKQQDLDRAIHDFEEVVRLDPDNALGWKARAEYHDAYLDRGTESLKKNDFAAAVADLERASQCKPPDSRVFSRLGAAWANQGQWERAVENFTRAVQIEPNDVDYLNRGLAYRRLQATDKAIADFKDAIRLNSRNADAHYWLGDAYLDKDDAANALSSLSQAIQIWSGDPEAPFLANAYCLRAGILLSSDKNAAAADLDQVLKSGRPEDRSSAHGLLDAMAASYAEAGQLAKAAQWEEKARDNAPDEATRKVYQERLEKYRASHP